MTIPKNKNYITDGGGPVVEVPTWRSGIYEVIQVFVNAS
ncbi:hypothetical protein PanWU01x14_289730 [Parasponia andersonii]|uniref:Uncharacterized protein n=1 Tax=Parasponia andersonii TaxID=3476 RepID=A0A2P5AY14_PARAD|nr:hypothetical protein PanWU01x14_289730 [Parasponia andersonii]